MPYGSGISKSAVCDPCSPFPNAVKKISNFLSVVTSLVLMTGMVLADDNQLTKKEQKAGWTLLFDGKTLSGWKRFGKDQPPGPGWSVQKGMLHLSPGGKGGDIITTGSFTDFELQWEWKIAPKANNGLKYLVTESRPRAPGPEYQMVDDATMEHANHRTGALYHILDPNPKKRLHPPGQWNQSRLVIKGQRVEHWLNGRKILEYKLESPPLKAAIAHSKFRDAPAFDKKIKGHLMLTDHKDEAWFRNIKLRNVSKK